MTVNAPHTRGQLTSFDIHPHIKYAYGPDLCIHDEQLANQGSGQGLLSCAAFLLNITWICSLFLLHLAPF